VLFDDIYKYPCDEYKTNKIISFNALKMFGIPRGNYVITIGKRYVISNNQIFSYKLEAL